MLREITQKMIREIDNKLKNNGLAKLHVQEKNPRGLMVEAAKACVGIKELTGKNDGEWVNEIQDTVGDRSESAWCMSFAQTMIAYAEQKTGVISPLIATEGCTKLWNASTAMRVKRVPLPGALAIWQHGDSWQGHVGIVLSSDGFKFESVEGNTGGSLVQGGPIEREGNGVYYRIRGMSPVGDMKLRGFIKPF